MWDFGHYNISLYTIEFKLVIFGVVNLENSNRRKKHIWLFWAIIISYVIAVLFITAGILAIVFRDKIKDVLNIVTCILAGVLLLLAGGWELYLGIKALVSKNKNGASKEKKKSKKDDQVVATQQEQPKEDIKEIDYTSNKIE